MKKLLLFGGISGLMFFWSCEKSRLIPEETTTIVIDNTVEIDAGNVENAEAGITTIKAIIYTDGSNPEEGWYHTIATAAFKDGSFKISLPATLPDHYLRIHGREGVTLSDPGASGALIYFVACNEMGRDMGRVHLLNINGDRHWHAQLIYADRDFTENGRSRWTRYKFEYDNDLKKGWNMVYSGELLQTTNRPSHIVLKWKYEKIKLFYTED